MEGQHPIGGDKRRRGRLLRPAPVFDGGQQKKEKKKKKESSL